ncbi:HAMP domain-containing histidine kinase [Corallococcus sp. M34]|uniref:PAS domain-containing sensor histidine kinase n=1 Tax=Citreicoccus inhibens TaxID=2849499 RepID=UPI001C210683|nr:HAMP domain-containing sensor histidine kinase [Citreicoccus inhibens]MBU8899347.1 HAMP domain-containing histidine kinase [Citreicoccus inhibens]
MAEPEVDSRWTVPVEDLEALALVRVDSGGRVASWNVGAERRWGHPAAERVGQPFEALFGAGEAREGRPARLLREAEAHGVARERLAVARRDGGTELARVTVRRLPPETGGFGVVLHAEDGGLADMLREHEAFERRVLGILREDLDGPLATLQELALALLRSGELGGRLESAVGRIFASAERVHRVFGSVLDFAQAKVGGGLVLQYRSFDLHELVEHALDGMAQAHAGRALRHAQSGEGHGDWDPERVGQLLVHLVSNAVLHGAPDGVVTVGSHGAQDGVRFEVHNEGPAIPAERLPHLFEPREHTEAGRVGLGLFLARQIVLAHHGTLAVTSTESGGTTFTAWLPRWPPRPGR